MYIEQSSTQKGRKIRCKTFSAKIIEPQADQETLICVNSCENWKHCQSSWSFSNFNKLLTIKQKTIIDIRLPWPVVTLTVKRRLFNIDAGSWPIGRAATGSILSTIGRKSTILLEWSLFLICGWYGIKMVDKSSKGKGQILYETCINFIKPSQINVGLLFNL